MGRLVLPDGEPFDESRILSGGDSPDPIKEDIDEKNYLYNFDDPEDGERPLATMACRPPDAWSAVRSSKVRGTTYYPISHVWGPSRIDETVTITADWTVTKGYEIEGGVGWSIGVLEAQARVKLDETVTTSRGESQRFTIPKGQSVHMLAQIIYRQTDLTRNSYAGPNCQPYAQSLTVLTPISYATVIARA